MASLLVGDEPMLAETISLLFLPGCMLLSSLLVYKATKKKKLNNKNLNKLLYFGQRSENLAVNADQKS